MISLLLTMTRHGSKVCMLVYTPMLFQLRGLVQYSSAAR